MQEKPPPPPDIRFASLYKHWVTADAVRARMLLPLPQDGSNLPPELAEISQTFSSMHALVVFYGLLYVVVEGYQALSPRYEMLDDLLSEGNYVSQLKRFRNATFHYQEDPFDKRLTNFLNEKDSAVWIKRVHLAFEDFFRSSLPINDVLGTFCGASH